MSIQSLEALTPKPAPVHELNFDDLKAIVARLPQGESGRGPIQTLPMAGGASTRRYFRVSLSDGQSAVAMFVPEGAKPEEVQKEAVTHRWPFLEVRDLLSNRGIDVPRLLGEDTEHGWILLEDLGEDTLANYLLSNPNSKTALYTRAVVDLALAQQKLMALPDSSIVATRAFDFDLLYWEIDHFREWGLDARGITLSEADRSTFEAIGRRLASQIADWPRGFVHRDYQSRNLMVRPGETLCWIDFQDALLGPRVYDLVALLNDSYQVFERDFVVRRLEEFAATLSLNKAEQEELVRQFDLVTVQRKLKDAGRFVFIDRVKNNPAFLPFVPGTIEKVFASLERLQDDEDMRNLSNLLRRVLS